MISAVVVVVKWRVAIAALEKGTVYLYIYIHYAATLHSE